MPDTIHHSPLTIHDSPSMLTPPFRISVKTLAFFEPILAREMEELGAPDIEIGKRVVHCTGDLELVYKLNYQLRTALRVLVNIAFFKSRNPDQLYKLVKEMPWEDYITEDRTFAIDPNVKSGQYKLPHFAALKVKDAIADRFTERTGRRPDVNPQRPDIQIHLHIDEEKVTLSLDSSGSSLNQRGYRKDGGAAPLNEVLAAGLLVMSGWDRERPLVDPMCGSGTIAIEAAMMAANMPAQINRPFFGFTRWPDFQPDVWSQIVNEAKVKMLPAKGNIWASDISEEQLKIARDNIRAAGLSGHIEVSRSDFFRMSPPAPDGCIVMNPPYGERIQPDALNEFYRQIGEALKHRWHGYKAWIISSEQKGFHQIGLRPFRKWEVFNGPLECRFQGYELYAGTKKAAKE